MRTFNEQDKDDAMLTSSNKKAIRRSEKGKWRISASFACIISDTSRPLSAENRGVYYYCVPAPFYLER